LDNLDLLCFHFPCFFSSKNL